MKILAQLLGAVMAILVIFSVMGVRLHSTPNSVPAPPRPDRELDQGRRRLLPLRPLREGSVDSRIRNGEVLWAADNTGPGGLQPMVDYPEELWKKNIAGSDGSGMCVFRSCEFQALWLGLPFKGFTEWCARGPGGGYPEKLAKLFSAFCKEKHIPEPTLIQYEGNDFSWIESCLANGWLPCVTLYHSPRYGSGTIYHMTCAAHLDKTYGATQDNNFLPVEWAPRAEWQKRCMLNGQFWAFAIVGAGVPLPPRN